MYLDELSTGARAKIKKLRVKDGYKRRIEDLGFTEGAEVTCVLTAPFSDPRAYRIRGTVIALRNSQARDIEIWEG